jgi:hypothetical protein
MVEQGKHIRRGWNGRYLGFRINREQVPTLPAWAVRRVWDDPRKIPYLFVWKGRSDGVLKEAVRVVRNVPQPNFLEADSVEIKRTDGSTVTVNLVWQGQIHGGRSLLFQCGLCQKPSRALYGAKVGDDGRYYRAVRADWGCRRCAGLRYSSEGGALVMRGGILSRIFRRPIASVSCPRPDVWHPYVFTDLDQAIDALQVQ